MNEPSTTHIANLTWLYVDNEKRFIMDVSYGVEANAHGIGTTWTKELHLAQREDGSWHLDEVTSNAPCLNAPLVSTYVFSNSIASGADVCGLLDQGLHEARSIQAGIDEEDDVAS